MSRTAFAVRFRELVGQSPLQYVTRCRMDRAAEMLRSTEVPIAEVAGKVGYDSEAGFGRAFQRHIGQAPAAYRKQLKTERGSSYRKRWNSMRGAPESMRACRSFSRRRLAPTSAEVVLSRSTGASSVDCAFYLRWPAKNVTNADSDPYSRIDCAADRALRQIQN